MSSSDSWTLIGLTILVVLLLFYLSKKMICGSNGNNGDSSCSSTTTGHHPEHNHEDSPHPNHYPQDHLYHPDYEHQNPAEHRLNLDYNYNQQQQYENENEIQQTASSHRPSYYYHHHYQHHYHPNLLYYPSQSLSLRELLEICSNGSSNNATAPVVTSRGNYVPSSAIDNQHCHDSPGIDINTNTDTTHGEAAGVESGLVQVSVISDPTSNNSAALTERKKHLIEVQLRAQILRMVQAEREVRRLAHLLSLEQGRVVPDACSTLEPDNINPPEQEGVSEPSSYYEYVPPPPPDNPLFYRHPQHYQCPNHRREVILSAHALSSRYVHPSLVTGRGGQRQDDQTVLDLDQLNHQDHINEEAEIPPPSYEACVSANPPS